MNFDVFKEYGIYDPESFWDKTIFNLGFNKTVTNEEIDFLRNVADVQFQNVTGIKSFIESTRGFFRYYKLYETNQNFFVYKGRNFFCEFKDFYKNKFGLDDELYFTDWEYLDDCIIESFTWKEDVVSIDGSYGVVYDSSDGPIGIIRDFFDYIDSTGFEFPYHLFYNHNTHAFVFCCNITQMENHLTSIQFDWQSHLNRMFNIPLSSIKYDYNNKFGSIFPSDSDTLQFLLPVKLLFPYSYKKIDIVFNGKDYVYEFDNTSDRDPVGYYIYRFCKSFYIMTGITPFEWTKKEISHLEFNLDEVEDVRALKDALPELEIQHRKIFVENDFEEK